MARNSQKLRERRFSLRRASVILPLFVIGLLMAAGCQTLRESEQSGVPAAVPSPPREFRAAWVATVANIDWPSERGLSTAKQQEEMRAILDRAVELNLNAIILQVRPAADALYDSPHEPWSEFLTGEMGRPPEPFYDPLTFAVEEAHERGLELHAWFNPYRALHPSARSEISPDHISRRRPDVVREYGTHLWLDPGEPGAHEHTLGVILDVVERYDVDGIHFDDYFYPYKAYVTEGSTEFPDSASYARSGSSLSRDDWRRSNVDRLVEELYREIRARKPHVKFGISPFGIWRPGYPEGVSGFDAHSELYADARKWLRQGWVDYFTPQIYYRMAQHNQPYPIMLNWWIEQNVHRRHMWPGNFTSRAGRQWPLEEISGQIYATRAQPGASGNVHFSMRAFMQNDSLVSDLLSKPYAQPALVPASTWIDDTPPGRPSAFMRKGGTLVMTPADDDDVWLWVIRARRGSDWSTSVVPGRQREFQFDGDRPVAVAVSAVDRLGNEGSVFMVEASPTAALHPQIIPHSEWEVQPRVGHAADGTRRNIAPGDSLHFRDLTVRLLEMQRDTAVFVLRSRDRVEERMLADGDAISWNGYRVVVLALNAREGLGAGLAEMEVATLVSLPALLATSPIAGGAEQRLRIPHEIRRITLHHTGSPEPLSPEDNPIEKLRGLQAWGQSDRNWWDVPYHFLIDLEGRIYEGRDYRYMGETNTSYDPSGHLLISVIGNYNRQEPTPAQIEAITDLMAWASAEFDVPPTEISGHGDWVDTSCPGRHLRKYLDDGTFVRGVRERLQLLSAN